MLSTRYPSCRFLTILRADSRTAPTTSGGRESLQRQTVLAAVLTPLLALLAIGGCSQPSSAIPNAPQAVAPKREIWEILYIQGSRAGYGHTTYDHPTRNGQTLLRIENDTHLVAIRDQQRSEQTVRWSEWNTPEGQLLEFESEMTMGPTPMRISGRVVRDQLQLVTSTQGKTLSNSIPWSAGNGGCNAMELSLLQRPMQPGEHRKLHSLVPGLNQVAAIELAAQRSERVALLNGSYDLLRIDTVTRFADGQTLPGTLWADRTGEVLKNHTDSMNMDSYRSDKVTALQEQDVGKLDLTLDMSVKIDKPLVLGHAAKRVRYRVRLAGGDPAGVFVVGPSQQVRSIDPHTAEVTVIALRPGQPPLTSAADETTGADDLQPNNLVQSDDPRIVSMAREAAHDEKDPWKVACALEAYVHGYINKKDFSQAFATAAEVAVSHEGDCTEHSVLLAALARARGIPARVAIGLVYVERAQTFGYHMWDEVFIEKHWIPIDGTLARGGIGGGHLKLAHSSLKGGSAYASFLPVAKVGGRLRIEVLGEE